MATKHKTLSAEGHAVLSRATVEPNAVVLNDPNLDRALYREVDQFLLALGGKWSRSHKCHQFPGGTDGVLAAIHAGEALDRLRTFEQFYTPEDLALRMIELAGEVVLFDPGVHVLEPSAGTGALIWEPLRRCANVTAIEIDRDNLPALLKIDREVPGVLRGVLRVATEDFMHWDPTGPGTLWNVASFEDAHAAQHLGPIDVVLMNPPFSRGQDVAHVRRALGFLRPGGVLVAITSHHWTFAQDRASQEFRWWFAARGGEVWNLPSGAFKQSGTGVETRMIRIVKPGART